MWLVDAFIVFRISSISTMVRYLIESFCKQNLHEMGKKWKKKS